MEISHFKCTFIAARYQNELPKLIKKRGKDAHLIHEELVQCMEWKQSVSITLHEDRYYTLSPHQLFVASHSHTPALPRVRI